MIYYIINFNVKGDISILFVRECLAPFHATPFGKIDPNVMLLLQAKLIEKNEICYVIEI